MNHTLMHTSSFVSFASFLAACLALGAGCTVTTTSAPSGSDAGTSTSTSTPEADAGASDPHTGSDAGAVTGGCAFGEPNDTRDNATPIVVGTPYTGCVSSSDDSDFYEFTAPDDHSGGYVSIAITGVGDGSIAAEVFTVSDNGSLASVYTTTPGQSLPMFAAVAPKGKYRLRISDFAAFKGEYKYDVKLTYTKFADDFEPNNKRDDAKAIAKNTPVEAILAPVYQAAQLTAADWDDWYKVDLDAASTSVILENVPTNIPANVEIFDAGGTLVANKYNVTSGANVVVDPFAANAGTYYVRVGYFAAPPDSAGKGDIPDHFTRRYRLTVNQ